MGSVEKHWLVVGPMAWCEVRATSAARPTSRPASDAHRSPDLARDRIRVVTLPSPLSSGRPSGRERLLPRRGQLGRQRVIRDTGLAAWPVPSVKQNRANKQTQTNKQTMLNGEHLTPARRRAIGRAVAH